MFYVFTPNEARLNSRPQVSESSDPNDINASTSRRFLTGGPITAIADKAID